MALGETRSREKPMDRYDCYKARWSKVPVLQVLPHWTWPGKEGREVSVFVHSNCDEVELLLNGVSQGRQATEPFEHLEWKVKYAPGKLVAKGRRRSGSVKVVLETAGASSAIRLTADRVKLSADNADLAVVMVEVIDEEGRVVPVAGNRLTFTITGPARLLGVGNAAPGGREPDEAGRGCAFNGLAQAIVQATLQKGVIGLKVESPGLESARITLRSR